VVASSAAHCDQQGVYGSYVFLGQIQVTDGICDLGQQMFMDDTSRTIGLQKQCLKEHTENNVNYQCRVTK
jgi:hypothetical protein